MKKNIYRWLALLSLVLAGCQADQTSKTWAIENFREEPRMLVPGLLEFRYAENPAIAFSMLRSVPEGIRTPIIYILAAISLSALAAFAWMHRTQGARYMIPIALILAGAFGNLVDRMKHGFVVDFVRVHWQEAWSFPIFNLADSLISVGMAVLILQALFERKSEPMESAPA